MSEEFLQPVFEALLPDNVVTIQITRELLLHMENNLNDLNTNVKIIQKG